MGELDNMRFLLAAATCVVSVGLLAGCSTASQDVGTLPGSSIGQPTGRVMQPYTPKGGINPKDVLRLQAAGKIGYLGSRAEVEKAYGEVESQPLHLHAKKKSGSGGIYATLTYYDYILGINSKGTEVTKAYQTTSCTEPYGLKVDHSQNIWVGCYVGNLDTPTAQEYSANGTQLASYNAACPSNWQSASETTCNSYFYGYEGYDSAADSAHVFVDGFFYGYNCSTPTCTYEQGNGIEYWPAGQPSATPTLILLTYGAPVYNLYYMDEDPSGNLWVGFYGCTTSCGYGLGEISLPTSSPTFTVIEPPGTYEANGGVYVSNGGSTLNVLDPETRITYQYTLPLTTGGSPSNKLGPNAPFGYPEGIGFNSTDKSVVLGDEDAWLNIGTVSSNKWKQTKPVLLISDVFGSAYSPSDK